MISPNDCPKEKVYPYFFPASEFPSSLVPKQEVRIEEEKESSVQQVKPLSKDETKHELGCFQWNFTNRDLMHTENRCNDDNKIKDIPRNGEVLVMQC